MVFIEIAVVLALILGNAVLAMSELALVSSRRSRLKALVADGTRGARTALKLVDDPTGFLSTVQIGITLVGVVAGAFSGTTLAVHLADGLRRWSVLAPHADTIAILLVVPAVTYLSLVVGELAPKRIALQQPERTAARLAPAMQQLARLAAPAVWLLKGSTDGLLRVTGLRGGRTSTVSEDEVRLLIAEGTRAGVFVPREREMIEGVLRLADRAARAVMTPRIDVAWLEDSATGNDIAAFVGEKRFSRIPVCQGTIDNPLGIVHAKDLIGPALRGQPIRLSDYLVAPLVVPERVSVLTLLDLFRRRGLHMAIVVDEYGSTEGIVTLTDVLRSVTGELPEIGESAEMGLLRREDGSWLVDGGYPIDEFEDRVGLEGLRGDGDFDTVAGWVLHRLGRLPAVGDGFAVDGGHVEVLDMDELRIDKVLYVPQR
jgi:putative hemolysin